MSGHPQAAAPPSLRVPPLHGEAYDQCRAPPAGVVPVPAAKRCSSATESRRNLTVNGKRRTCASESPLVARDALPGRGPTSPAASRGPSACGSQAPGGYTYSLFTRACFILF
eukprot:scaffold637_cov118-Isochrysis_galbana.AAC.24